MHYNEAVDGDISATDPLTTFTLDAAGLNTITGSMARGGSCPTGSDPDFDCDSFGLHVASGYEIVALSVSTRIGDLIWRVGTGLFDYGGSLIGHLTGVDSLSGVLPLTGELNISWDSFAMSLGAVDYRFTIETRAVQGATPAGAAVPEPGTAALLALCLGGLALQRRRSGRA